MATDWVRVGTDVVVGGGAGAIDQLLQNEDDKRIAVKPTLGVMSQYGTYYNYGVPILAVLGTAVGWLKGDMATRLVTAGSQLAGRKVVKQVTKKAVPWAGWRRQPGGGGVPQLDVVGGERTIPVIEEAAILV